jgi:hypothetical protein
MSEASDTIPFVKSIFIPRISQKLASWHLSMRLPSL